MCRPRIRSQESAVESILPILIMFIVYLALNKTQTGSFF